MNQLENSQACSEASATDGGEALDSEVIPSLERLTRLAAQFFDVPIAAIFLSTGDHLQLKASTGLAGCEVPEINRLCEHVIVDNAPHILLDTSDFGQFQASFATATNLHLRFFACLHLASKNGQQIGTLCIADHVGKPSFSEGDTTNLQDFAMIAADLLKQHVAEQCYPTTSDVLAAISHDLRTPLNGVLGMSELLIAADDLSKGHRRRAEVIQRSGRSLLSMLESLLDFAKYEDAEQKLECSSVDLVALTRDTLADWQKKAGRNSRISFVGDFQDHCHILGNASAIRKLLTHFSESLGRFLAEASICLTLEFVPIAGRIRMGLKAEGMPVDCHAKDLLEPFMQSSDITSGGTNEANLDLLVCDRIAMMMGGHVGARCLGENNVALWVNIVPSLNLLEYPTESPPFRPITPNLSDGQSEEKRVSLNVLVAEDDPDMAMLIEELLEEAGHRVTIAPDGASFMRILDEEPIDLVLMDGRLPDISGFEAVKYIRKLSDKRATMPIIALTGDAMVGDRERYLSAGMDDYIAKPVDYETLIATIDHHRTKRKGYSGITPDTKVS